MDARRFPFQVFIATRALHDEELFLDYKLREDGPLEPWYCPVLKQREHT